MVASISRIQSPLNFLLNSFPSTAILIHYSAISLTCTVCKVAEQLRMMSVAPRISGLVWLPLRRASSYQQVIPAQPDACELATARPYSEVPGPTPLPLIGNTWRLLPLIGTYVNIFPDYPVPFLILCTSLPTDYPSILRYT
jgi:hypothetical protein